ncbi:MAG: hypothetical protein E7478_02915 [Ruminococcaceae bacterium]|nr:hypothetical protein [Oscillospiraceae bacterium]
MIPIDHSLIFDANEVQNLRAKSGGVQGMTPVALLDCIVNECDEATEDLLLPVRGEKGKSDEYRRPLFFKMDLPQKEDDIKQIPYILVQVLGGLDEQPSGDLAQSDCTVRIVMAVYSPDMGEGKLNVLNIITRIRMRLLQREIIGGQFLLKEKIEWAIDPRPETPYYFGEMVMKFELPAVLPKCISEYMRDE